MKTFDILYSRIQTAIDNNDTGNAMGPIFQSEFDEEDRRELMTWKAEDNTTYTKVVQGKEFTFELVLKNNESE